MTAEKSEAADPDTDPAEASEGAASEAGSEAQSEADLRRRRRRIAGAVGFGVVLAIGGTALAVKPVVERKVDTALRDLAEANLRPALAYDELRYELPLGLEARAAKLSGDGLDILAVDDLSFSLGEIPRPGRPVRIEAIAAEGVSVRVAKRGESILGWNHFLVRPENPDVKPSEVFRLHSVELEDVEVQWSPREDEQLVIQGIDARIDVDRSRAGEGIYALEFESNRGKLVDISVSATLDVNAFRLEIEELELNVKVDEETRNALPVVVRAFVDEHALEGTLTATVTGTFPIADPLAGALQLHLEMRDFTMSLGDWSVPAERLEVDAKLAERKVSIESIELDAVGGALTADGTVDFNQAPPTAKLDWKVSGLSLATALPGTDFAGSVSASGSLHGDVGELSTLRGGGSVHLADGRIVSAPIFRELVRRSDATSEGRQSGSAKLRLGAGAKRVHVSELELDMPVLGIRGDGHLDFDGGLKLGLKVGPLQKIEGDGPLRRVLRSGGAIVQYCVEGTTSDPRITPRPFGIGC